MTRHVVYLRVSTERQGRSGLGLEAQRASVAGFLGDRQPIAELVEIESGKRSDRPKLAEALRLCRLDRATLVIAKLDRLARNVSFIAALMDSDVPFLAVDFPQANRLTIHILAAVAEHEARAISDRTKAALQAARARGVRLGGDRGKLASVRDLGAAASALARAERARARAVDVGPVIASLSAAGMSLRAVAAELGERGISAPRGGAWTATSVRRVMMMA